ncbi:AlpA family phage regulatory protein [Agarivorans sp. B2Z047]|uniref:helix-turn-helix transcriptional regulator n=1 Tax=Agarivorans sp. B2Z047 TaxID=2652721 RepID=UPI00128C1FEF|nr:AlpA family transcriptional regulator [Agarivorans sp. B2Z047]MPW31884.1 AlpA family phage regulatory protein [Agarivorans sp. B2Z047]UQN43681.1 AlpA family transcriptional regulator [Agarivorans sp. B2Z047]
MRLIKLTEVLHLTGLSRSVLYQYTKANTFPQSVPLGTRAVAWVESEVLEWIEQCIQTRDKVNKTTT